MSIALRVLIVEDSQDDALLLLRALQRDGYDPIYACVDSSDAMHAALDRQDWDLVISDYSMPHFNGLAALALVQERGLDLPFILVSGTIGEESAVAAMRAGAHDYLMKGNLARLSPAVARELHEAEMRQAGRRAEEQLHQAEARYRTLVERVPAISYIVALDQAGSTLYISPQIETILGFSQAEWMAAPEPWVTQLHREDIERVLTDRVRPQAADAPLSSEFRMLARDGRVVWFRDEAVVVRDDAGQPLYRQGVMFDITERKQTEAVLEEERASLAQRVAERTADLSLANEQLSRAARLKDEFFASVSHELRTPLNAIIGFTGTLLMRLPGPLTDDQYKQLRIIQTSAKHLLALINDMLDLAKIESGHVGIKREPLIYQEVIEEVLTSLRPLVDAKGLGVEVEAPREALVVWTDRRVLSQILINLANNAIKFTDTGKVRLELCRRQEDGRGLTAISVTDTGIGIRPEDQTKLFQAFTQLDASDTRRQMGTGLGLHVSQKLAHLLGGQITVQSEYGTGSTFTLVMPEA